MSRNPVTRRIRRAYNQGELARICTLREDRFGRAFGMETVEIERRWEKWPYSGPPENYYHFRDNDSSVLAVAHLDTVVSQKGRTPHFSNTKSGPLITSGALDDRLGAYVILNLLPKLGVNCDWLLTVGEESGQSTAESFKSEKDYDWVIEFDRGGTDVVMYQYMDEPSIQAVEASGARVGIGSFSDIAYLEHLGIKAFNWGVGYQGDYHSEKGYAYLNNTFAMVAKYLRFHTQNAGVAMPHDSSYEDLVPAAYGEYFLTCDVCQARDAVDAVTFYCKLCGSCQDCGGFNPDIVAEWGDPDAIACMCYLPEVLQREHAELDRTSYALS